MKFMGFITSYSWILSMIILNNGIITVNSFPLSIDGLIEFGMNLLMDTVMGTNEEESIQMKMDDLASKIDNMEKAILNSEKTIIKELKQMIQYNSAIRDFVKSVTYINYLSKLFRSYATGMQKRTLKNFAALCLTIGDNGLKYKLHDLVENVAPSLKHGTSIFALIVEPYKEPASAAAYCDEISLHQRIYNMYGEILTYIIKGYSMIFNAYEILRKMHKGTFELEKESTRSLFREAVRRVANSALSVMRISSRDLRPCDPVDDVEGETYIELKWLFNSWATTEAFLLHDNPDIRNAPCHGDCEKFDAAYVRSETNMELAPLMRCNGRAYACFETMMRYYCPSKISGRRYEKLTPKRNEIKDCNGSMPIPKTRTGAIERDAMFYFCDYCICLCDDLYHPDTVRRFSLTEVLSDSKRNRVITGLRFVEQHKVIYIQIQEGKLRSNGRISGRTIKWQDVGRQSDDKFWTINWDQRNVNLDTIIAPAGQVMTGVKFSVLDSHLRLSIKATRYDYLKGKITGEYSEWYSNNEAIRTLIKLENVKSPIDTEDENIVALEDDPTIQFQMSGWYKDYAQTAVPFLDAQPVYSDPLRIFADDDDSDYEGQSYPLSGAGLYYKGRKDYGGFIGLKLITYNYAAAVAKDLISQISDDDSDEDVEEEANEIIIAALEFSKIYEELEFCLGYDNEFRQNREGSGSIKMNINIQHKDRRRNQRLITQKKVFESNSNDKDGKVFIRKKLLEGCYLKEPVI